VKKSSATKQQLSVQTCSRNRNQCKYCGAIIPDSTKSCSTWITQ